MLSYRVIALYTGVGIGLNSIFDIWYVDRSYPTAEFVRFGFNYPPINYELPIVYGYLGAVASGALVGAITWMYFRGFFPALDKLRLQHIAPPTLSMFVFVGSVLTISQFLGGASWSKLLLDGIVVFTVFLILVTHVRSFSVFDIVFTMYMPLAFALLTAGLAWANFVSEYTTPTTSHFVFALLSFAVRASYITFVSLVIVLYNTSELTDGQLTIDDFLE